jgi:hypothetical protein
MSSNINNTDWVSYLLLNFEFVAEWLSGGVLQFDQYVLLSKWELVLRCGKFSKFMDDVSLASFSLISFSVSLLSDFVQILYSITPTPAWMDSRHYI